MDAQTEYQRWLADPFIDSSDKDYLIKIKDEKALIEELFYRNISFGTAGMRGIIGIGANRINKYQVAKATQAYADSLNNKYKGSVKIAIAYDTRHYSAKFAEMAARVLLENGIQVCLFEGVRPVPELSFAIRCLKAQGGIVITASHNSKEYNGYKLYSSYGGQMVSEDMQPIMDQFNNLEDSSKIKLYKGHLKEHKLFTSIGKDIDELFFNEILRLQLTDDIDLDTRVIYSSLHGTGVTCVPEILRRKGFRNVFTVKEQDQPDPDFSTVALPNPEDPKALTKAIELAQKENGDLVIATDPDCDRVGIAIQNGEGRYVTLNGNQIGALLIDYILSYKKERGKHPVIIQTVVTSGFGKKIAESQGVEVVEVLTGFKYIGELMTAYEKSQEKTFLFGYEESYGSLAGMHARDKDAANACMLLSEMAACYKKQGKNIYQRLQALYEKYGYYYDAVHNIAFEGISGMQKMSQIMDYMRSLPIKEIDGQNVWLTDYMSKNTGLPFENALKYILEDGSWVALRPSGTEPKLKIYFSMAAESMEKAQSKCERIKTFVLEKMSV